MFSKNKLLIGMRWPNLSGQCKSLHYFETVAQFNPK